MRKKLQFEIEKKPNRTNSIQIIISKKINDLIQLQNKLD